MSSLSSVCYLVFLCVWDLFTLIVHHYSLSYYNKLYLAFNSDLVWAAVTEYHRLGGLNSKHLFLTVLEAGSLRSGCRPGWLLSEVSLPCLQMAAFSLYPYVGETERVSYLPLLIRILIPSWGSTFMTWKVPAPNTIILGLQHLNFRGTQTFVRKQIGLGIDTWIRLMMCIHAGKKVT